MPFSTYLVMSNFAAVLMLQLSPARAYNPLGISPQNMLFRRPGIFFVSDEPKVGQNPRVIRRMRINSSEGMHQARTIDD
jgi:hypothetical protein